MRHLFNINEFNQRHMEFISSNTSAGAPGKEPQPAGSVSNMSLDSGYYKNLSNAFGKMNIRSQKVKAARKPKPKPKHKLFKKK